MDYSLPIKTSLPAGMPGFERLKALLGHYDFRVYLNDASYVHVGAGSLSAMNCLARPYHLPAGLLGTIGRYCEVNDSARISSLSEHHNDRIVNVTFAGTPFLRERHRGTSFHEPFAIGSGVVISAGVQVLAGARIGDGVVIGAGAVVTKEAERGGIYAGVPAKKLRDRQMGAKWWDFDTAYLLEHIANIEATARLPEANHRYRVDRPRFAIMAKTANVQFMGFVDGDVVAPLDSGPPDVRDYVVQALSSETPYWLADCWA